MSSIEQSITDPKSLDLFSADCSLYNQKKKKCCKKYKKKGYACKKMSEILG